MKKNKKKKQIFSDSNSLVRNTSGNIGNISEIFPKKNWMKCKKELMVLLDLPYHLHLLSMLCYLELIFKLFYMLAYVSHW